MMQSIDYRIRTNNDKLLHIHFLETNEWYDWFLHFFTWSKKPIKGVHGGYAGQFELELQRIAVEVDFLSLQYAEHKEIKITGFSYGCTSAVLFADHLVKKKGIGSNRIEIKIFGSPNFCKDEGIKRFSYLKIKSYKIGNDLIMSIPPNYKQVVEPIQIEGYPIPKKWQFLKRLKNHTEYYKHGFD